MRSKVQIPLGANNSFETTCRRSQSIIRSMWRGVLHRSEVYLTGVGTRSSPTLEGFLVIKKIKKIKKKKKKGFNPFFFIGKQFIKLSEIFQKRGLILKAIHPFYKESA
jgi:hypothetical protein